MHTHTHTHRHRKCLKTHWTDSGLYCTPRTIRNHPPSCQHTGQTHTFTTTHTHTRFHRNSLTPSARRVGDRAVRASAVCWAATEADAALSSLRASLGIQASLGLFISALWCHSPLTNSTHTHTHTHIHILTHTSSTEPVKPFQPFGQEGNWERSRTASLSADTHKLDWENCRGYRLWWTVSLLLILMLWEYLG